MKPTYNDALEHDILLADVYQQLDEGEKQIAEGKERDGDEVLKRLKEKHFGKFL